MARIRVSKVADQIRDELARLLPHEVAETHQALVTVTAVTLSADMRHAHVHVSIFPETAPRKEIFEAMDRARGRLKGRLGRELRLRHVPDIVFRLDSTAEKGERIERLLREAALPPSGAGTGGAHSDDSEEDR